MENTKTLREQLIKAFNDEELRTLCYDCFPEVYEQFTTGMTKGSLVQQLLEHCIRRGKLDQLIEALNRERPGMFRRPLETTPSAMPDPGQRQKESSILETIRQQLLDCRQIVERQPFPYPAMLHSIPPKLSVVLDQLRGGFGEKYRAGPGGLQVANLYYRLTENLSRLIDQVQDQEQHIQDLPDRWHRQRTQLLSGFAACMDDLSALAYQLDQQLPTSIPASDIATPPSRQRPTRGIPRDLHSRLMENAGLFTIMGMILVVNSASLNIEY